MKKLNPRTTRILALLALGLFLAAIGYGIWVQTRGTQPAPSTTCDPYSYAEQASNPGTCQ